MTRGLPSQLAADDKKPFVFTFNQKKISGGLGGANQAKESEMSKLSEPVKKRKPEPTQQQKPKKASPKKPA